MLTDGDGSSASATNEEPLLRSRKASLMEAIGKILWLAIPSILQQGTDWLRPIVFNIFVSRNVRASSMSTVAAEHEMDSVSLAIMSVNLLCFATAWGFNNAIDAFAPVAFGRRDHKELHRVLYRQMVLLSALTAMAVTLFRYSETILLAIGQTETVARRTSDLLKLLCWAVPGDFAYDGFARWMRGQQKNKQVALCSTLGFGVNLFINFTFADPHHPVETPVLALVAQNSLLPFLLIAVHLRQAGCFVAVSPRSILEGLGSQCFTGFLAAVWTCSEIWAWEAQVFEAAWLGPGNVAAYTLLSSTYSLLIMIPAGVSVATGALVGEALGRAELEAAALVLRAACLLVPLVVVGYATPLLLARFAIGEALGGGVADIVEGYANVVPWIMVLHVFDGLLGVLKSWLTVQKKQAFGASVSIFAYYVVGLPIGFVMAFRLGGGLTGLWLGVGTAVCICCAATFWRAWRDIQQMRRSERVPGNKSALWCGCTQMY